MDLIVKFLFLSGKYITCAAGKTILELINQSVRIKRHVSRKYEHITQMVGPYDNMLELMNARIEENTIAEMAGSPEASMKQINCDVDVSEASYNNDELEMTASRRDKEFEQIFADWYEDLCKSSTELKHEMKNNNKISQQDSATKQRYTCGATLQPKLIKQQFYAACANDQYKLKMGNYSKNLVPLSDRNAYMNKLVTESPDDSYYKRNRFPIRKKNKPVNVHSSAGVHNFKKSLLAHDDTIDLATKDFVADLKQEISYRTYTYTDKLERLTNSATCTTTFKRWHARHHICCRRLSSWQAFESNLEKKLQKKIYRIITRDITSLSYLSDNEYKDIDSQNRMDADVIKVNELAFNKLEQKVTQILIQQNLRDIEEVLRTKNRLRTLFPVVKRLNFDEICSNTSARIQNTVIKSLWEKKHASGIGDIIELLENEMQPAIFNAKRDNEENEKLNVHQVVPATNITSPPDEMMMLREKIEDENKIKTPKGLKSDLTEEQMKDIQQRTDILESNWRAFKIFEEYLQNVMIFDKRDEPKTKSSESKTNNLFGGFSIEAIYNSLFNRSRDNDNKNLIAIKDDIALETTKVTNSEDSRGNKSFIEILTEQVQNKLNSDQLSSNIEQESLNLMIADSIKEPSSSTKTVQSDFIITTPTQSSNSVVSDFVVAASGDKRFKGPNNNNYKETDQKNNSDQFREYSLKRMKKDVYNFDPEMDEDGEEILSVQKCSDSEYNRHERDLNNEAIIESFNQELYSQEDYVEPSVADLVTRLMDKPTDHLTLEPVEANVLVFPESHSYMSCLEELDNYDDEYYDNKYHPSQKFPNQKLINIEKELKEIKTQLKSLSTSSLVPSSGSFDIIDDGKIAEYVLPKRKPKSDTNIAVTTENQKKILLNIYIPKNCGSNKLPISSSKIPTVLMQHPSKSNKMIDIKQISNLATEKSASVCIDPDRVLKLQRSLQFKAIDSDQLIQVTEKLTPPKEKKKPFPRIDISTLMDVQKKLYDIPKSVAAGFVSQIDPIQLHNLRDNLEPAFNTKLVENNPLRVVPQYEFVSLPLEEEDIDVDDVREEIEDEIELHENEMDLWKSANLAIKQLKEEAKMIDHDEDDDEDIVKYYQEDPSEINKIENFNEFVSIVKVLDLPIESYLDFDAPSSLEEDSLKLSIVQTKSKITEPKQDINSVRELIYNSDDVEAENQELIDQKQYEREILELEQFKERYFNREYGKENKDNKLNKQGKFKKIQLKEEKLNFCNKIEWKTKKIISENEGNIDQKDVEKVEPRLVKRIQLRDDGVKPSQARENLVVNKPVKRIQLKDYILEIKDKSNLNENLNKTLNEKVAKTKEKGRKGKGRGGGGGLSRRSSKGNIRAKKNNEKLDVESGNVHEKIKKVNFKDVSSDFNVTDLKESISTEVKEKVFDTQSVSRNESRNESRNVIQNAIQNSRLNATQNETQNVIRNETQNVAQNAIQSSTLNATQNVIRNATVNTAQSGVQNATINTTQSGVQNVAQNATVNTTQSGVQNVAQNATVNTTQSGVQNKIQIEAQNESQKVHTLQEFQRNLERKREEELKKIEEASRKIQQFQENQEYLKKMELKREEEIKKIQEAVQKVQQFQEKQELERRLELERKQNVQEVTHIPKKFEFKNIQKDFENNFKFKEENKNHDAREVQTIQDIPKEVAFKNDVKRNQEDAQKVEFSGEPDVKKLDQKENQKKTQETVQKVLQFYESIQSKSDFKREQEIKKIQDARKKVVENVNLLKRNQLKKDQDVKIIQSVRAENQSLQASTAQSKKEQEVNKDYDFNISDEDHEDIQENREFQMIQEFQKRIELRRDEELRKMDDVKNCSNVQEFKKGQELETVQNFGKVQEFGKTQDFKKINELESVEEFENIPAFASLQEPKKSAQEFVKDQDFKNVPRRTKVQKRKFAKVQEFKNVPDFTKIGEIKNESKNVQKCKNIQELPNVQKLENVQEIQKEQQIQKVQNLQKVQNIEKVPDIKHVGYQAIQQSQKPENLTKKDQDFNQKTENLNQSSTNLNQKSLSLIKKSDVLNKKSEDSNKKSEDLNKKSEDLNKKSEDLNKKSEDLIKKPENKNQAPLNFKKSEELKLQRLDKFPKVSQITDLNAQGVQKNQLTTIKTSSTQKLQERNKEEVSKVKEEIVKNNDKNPEHIADVINVNYNENNVIARIQFKEGSKPNQFFEKLFSNSNALMSKIGFNKQVKNDEVKLKDPRIENDKVDLINKSDLKIKVEPIIETEKIEINNSDDLRKSIKNIFPFVPNVMNYNDNAEAVPILLETNNVKNVETKSLEENKVSFSSTNEPPAKVDRQVRNVSCTKSEILDGDIAYIIDKNSEKSTENRRKYVRTEFVEDTPDIINKEDKEEEAELIPEDKDDTLVITKEIKVQSNLTRRKRDRKLIEVLIPNQALFTNNNLSKPPSLEASLIDDKISNSTKNDSPTNDSVSNNPISNDSVLNPTEETPSLESTIQNQNILDKTVKIHFQNASKPKRNTEDVKNQNCLNDLINLNDSNSQQDTKNKDAKDIAQEIKVNQKDTEIKPPIETQSIVSDTKMVEKEVKPIESKVIKHVKKIEEVKQPVETKKEVAQEAKTVGEIKPTKEIAQEAKTVGDVKPKKEIAQEAKTVGEIKPKKEIAQEAKMVEVKPPVETKKEIAHEAKTVGDVKPKKEIAQVANTVVEIKPKKEIAQEAKMVEEVKQSIETKKVIQEIKTIEKSEMVHEAKPPSEMKKVVVPEKTSSLRPQSDFIRQPSPGSIPPPQSSGCSDNSNGGKPKPESNMEQLLGFKDDKIKALAFEIKPGTPKLPKRNWEQFGDYEKPMITLPIPDAVKSDPDLIQLSKKPPVFQFKPEENYLKLTATENIYVEEIKPPTVKEERKMTPKNEFVTFNDIEKNVQKTIQKSLQRNEIHSNTFKSAPKESAIKVTEEILEKSEIENQDILLDEIFTEKKASPNNNPLGNCKLLIREDIEIGRKSTHKLEQEFDEFEAKFVSSGPPETKSSIKSDATKNKESVKVGIEHATQNLKPIMNLKETNQSSFELGQISPGLTQTSPGLTQISPGLTQTSLGLNQPPPPLLSPIPSPLNLKPPVIPKQEKINPPKQEKINPPKPMRSEELNYYQKLQQKDQLFSRKQIALKVLEKVIPPKPMKSEEGNLQKKSAPKAMMDQLFFKKQRMMKPSLQIKNDVKEPNLPTTYKLLDSKFKALNQFKAIQHDESIKKNIRVKQESGDPKSLQSVLQKSPVLNNSDHRQTMVLRSTAQIQHPQFDCRLDEKVQLQEKIQQLESKAPKKQTSSNTNPIQVLQTQPQLPIRSKSPRKEIKVKDIEANKQHEDDIRIDAKDSKDSQLRLMANECQEKVFEKAPSKTTLSVQKSFEFKPLRNTQQCYKAEAAPVKTEPITPKSGNIIKSYEFNYMEPAMFSSKTETNTENTIELVEDLKKAKTMEQETKEIKKVAEEFKEVKKAEEKKVAEENKKLAEEKKRIDEEKKKIDEERKKIEEERKKLAEDKKKIILEEKKRIVEEKRLSGEDEKEHIFNNFEYPPPALPEQTKAVIQVKKSQENLKKDFKPEQKRPKGNELKFEPFERKPINKIYEELLNQRIENVKIQRSSQKNNLEKTEEDELENEVLSKTEHERRQKSAAIISKLFEVRTIQQQEHHKKSDELKAKPNISLLISKPFEDISNSVSTDNVRVDKPKYSPQNLRNRSKTLSDIDTNMIKASQSYYSNYHINKTLNENVEDKKEIKGSKKSLPAKIKEKQDDLSDITEDVNLAKNLKVSNVLDINRYIDVEEDQSVTDQINEMNKVETELQEPSTRYRRRKLRYRRVNEDLSSTRTLKLKKGIVPITITPDVSLEEQLPKYKTSYIHDEIEDNFGLEAGATISPAKTPKQKKTPNYFAKSSLDPVDYTLNTVNKMKLKETQAKPFVFDNIKHPKKKIRSPDRSKPTPNHLGMLWPRSNVEDKSMMIERVEKSHKVFSTHPTSEMSTSAVLDTVKPTHELKPEIEPEKKIHEGETAKIVYSFDDHYRKSTDDREIRQKKKDYWKTLQRDDNFCPIPSEPTITNELYGNKVYMKKPHKKIMRNVTPALELENFDSQFGLSDPAREEREMRRMKQALELEHLTAERKMRLKQAEEEEDKRKFGNVSPLLMYYLKQKEEKNAKPPIKVADQPDVFNELSESPKKSLRKEYKMQRIWDDKKSVIINVPTEGSIYDRYPLLRKNRKNQKTEEDLQAEQEAEYKERMVVEQQKREAERLSAQASLMAEERCRGIERKTSFANQTAVKFQHEPYGNKVSNMMKWKMRYNAHIEKLNTSGGKKYEENKLVKKFPFLRKYQKGSDQDCPESAPTTNWDQFAQLPYNPNATGLRNIKPFDGPVLNMPSSVGEAILPDTKKYIFKEKELKTALGKNIKVTYLVPQDPNAN
ncbi:reticulocyte-binding protein homolog 2a-like [Onthophagus taurus]|uniref:reticulocyte-binding protein homolog 2a-like n=1 Tax=Onthophagus taurus TaxID=166361 RepID=UPI000C1FF3AB|nr:uncharacterized protein LOC111422138 [Onthophagus taurus]